MSATELMTTTPVKAVRVRVGKKFVVRLLDANGGVVCQLGGNRAERAQAVFCYAVTRNAGVMFGRHQDGGRWVDAGLRADPAQARAYITTTERRWAKSLAMEQKAGTGSPARTVNYAMALLVEDVA